MVKFNQSKDLTDNLKNGVLGKTNLTHVQTTSKTGFNNVIYMNKNTEHVQTNQGGEVNKESF
uniref:Uncharacterized protein n=1 Tax=Anguilla anguilla TaxID=7936 RepID=A0A0E9WES2_ANGAN